MLRRVRGGSLAALSEGTEGLSQGPQWGLDWDWLSSVGAEYPSLHGVSEENSPRPRTLGGR